MDLSEKHLKTLNRAEILKLPPERIGDFELLNLAEYFREEEQDEDREMAVIELILRSPLNDEMVAYEELYLDLVNYYHRQKDFPALLRWAVAALAFKEQNESNPYRSITAWRDLADDYLWASDFNSGVGIYTRIIKRFPGDIWNYNNLGLVLGEMGLNELAVAVLERALARVAKGDPEQLRKQIKDGLQAAQANLAEGKDRSVEVDPETAAALRAALALPDGEEDPDQVEELAHLAPLDRLLTLDRQGDPALDAEILRQGRVLVPELIHLGMDFDLLDESLGPWHAARLLNVLRAGPAPELENLANWLDRTAAEDWQPWISAGSFGKIGGFTFAELEAIVRDPLYGDVTRETVLTELVERVEQQPELRPRVVDLLRELINRPGADQASEEIFTANLIGAAVDLKAEELLPQIQQAFAEDRVDKKILDEAYINGIWGVQALPQPPRRTDGLYLYLECTACGRAREHFTRFVVMDQTTLDNSAVSAYSPYILDHAVVCPKCGAVDQYKLRPFELIKLMQLDPEQMAAFLMNEKPKNLPRPDPHVYMIRGEAFGRRMHPLDTVAEYQRRIAKDPKNGELYMRLGNTLRIIGRYAAALENYHKAVELSPEDPEMLFPAATAEHDFGDPQAAQQLYERCVAQGSGLLSAAPGEINEYVVDAMRGLKALNKGEPSPWEYQIRNSEGQPLSPPERQLPGTPAKKDKQRKRHKK